MINLILTQLGNMMQRAVNNVFNAIISKDVFGILLSGLQQDNGADVVGIPGLSYLAKLLRIIGWIIFGLSSMLFLLKTMGLLRSKSNPITTAIKMSIAAMLIMNSQAVYQVISTVTENIYALFTTVWFGDSTISNELLKVSFSADIMENFIQFCFVIAIAMAMLGAIVSYLERVVLLCIYVYFYPIALGFAACEEGMETFVDWFKGVFSQIFAILLSYALIFMAMTAGTTGTKSALDLGFVSVDVNFDLLNLFKDTSMILNCTISIILFNASKNVEKILSMFNIKTMKATDASTAIEHSLHSAKQMTSNMTKSLIGNPLESISLKSPPSLASQNQFRLDGFVTKQNTNTMTSSSTMSDGMTTMQQKAKEAYDSASFNHMYKFDKKGNMTSSPDKKTRESMAIQAGVVQPPRTKKEKLQKTIHERMPIFGGADIKENYHRQHQFNEMMDGYAKAQYLAQQNFYKNQKNKAVHPTVTKEDGSSRIMTYKDISNALNIEAIKDFKASEDASVAWRDKAGNIAYQFTGTNMKNGNQETYIIGADSGVGENSFKVTSTSDITKSSGRNDDGELFNKSISRGEAVREGGFSINKDLYAYRLKDVDTYAYHEDKRIDTQSKLKEGKDTYNTNVKNEDWSKQFTSYKHVEYKERGMGKDARRNAVKDAINQDEKKDKILENQKSIKKRKYQRKYTARRNQDELSES